MVKKNKARCFTWGYPQNLASGLKIIGRGGQPRAAYKIYPKTTGTLDRSFSFHE